MNERYWIKHEMSEAEKRNTQLPCYDEKQNIFCSLIALLGWACGQILGLK